MTNTMLFHKEEVDKSRVFVKELLMDQDIRDYSHADNEDEAVEIRKNLQTLDQILDAVQRRIPVGIREPVAFDWPFPDADNMQMQQLIEERGNQVWREYAENAFLNSEYYGEKLDEDIYDWDKNEEDAVSLDGEHLVRFVLDTDKVIWTVYIVEGEKLVNIGICGFKHRGDAFLSLNTQADKYIRREVVSHVCHVPFDSSVGKVRLFTQVVGLIGK